MTRRKRRNHASTFKAKEALEVLKGEYTLAELAGHLSDRLSPHQDILVEKSAPNSLKNRDHQSIR